MMQYGLLGEKLGHSFSPQIHKKLGGYDYILCPTPPEQVETLIKDRDFKGLNVTIPYKKTVMPFCDYLTDKAKRIGSVNTLYFDSEEKLVGENTDYDGFSALAAHADISFEGKRVIILGSGGTSLTARTVALDEGAADIAVVSRSGEITYKDINKLHDYDILINTTPVGMYPNNEGMPVDLDIFDNLTGVIDVVYNPLKTRLVLEAEKRGIAAIGGLYMLVAQAKTAAEIFLSKEISQTELDSVYNTIKNSVTNIVLIGMPGCGKSSVARILERQLNRQLIDIDSEIVNTCGMSIPDIFARHSEQYFRDVETDVLKKCSAKSGVILSTGGGAVLREENRLALKQNGCIFMLDRDLEKLQTAHGRPLSKDRDAVKRLYDERIDIYKALADKIVDNNSDISKTVAAIAESF